MSFVPQDFAPAKGGNTNYTKLQAGDNRLRIVTPACLLGWSYWTHDNKCVRFAHNAKPTGTPNDIKAGEKVKEFMAVGVYNYETKAIEVWEITQQTVMGPIIDYSRHEDYGNPTNYGLTVKRTGNGKDTEYSVIAGVPKPLPAEIAKMVEGTPINLQALLTGGNVFDNHPAPGTAAPAPATAKAPAPALAGGADDDNDLPF